MSHAMNGLNGLEGMRNKGIKDRRSFEAFDKRGLDTLGTRTGRSTLK